MARIKIEKNKKNEPVFKLKLKDDEVEKYRLLKRALMESKKIKGQFNYMVPIRYFEVVFRNIKKEDLEIDKRSLNSYLEYSDDYDEIYYYRVEADAKFMKTWRLQGCPYIYKVSIDSETKEIKKELAFKKVTKININA